MLDSTATMTNLNRASALCVVRRRCGPAPGPLVIGLVGVFAAVGLIVIAANRQ